MKRKLLPLAALLCLLRIGRAGAQVGVIGGADGPTAIFLAAGGSGWPLAAAVAVALAVIIGLFFLARRDK